MRRASYSPFCLFGVLVMAACSTNRPEIANLFVEPESLNGENTTACGFLNFGFENHNFYPGPREAKNDEFGVGVTPGEVTYEKLLTYHSRHVCLSGVIRYSGCTVTSICSASNFPYEIVVNEISANRN